MCCNQGNVLSPKHKTRPFKADELDDDPSSTHRKHHNDRAKRLRHQDASKPFTAHVQWPDISIQPLLHCAYAATALNNPRKSRNNTCLRFTEVKFPGETNMNSWKSK